MVMQVSDPDVALPSNASSSYEGGTTQGVARIQDGSSIPPSISDADVVGNGTDSGDGNQNPSADDARQG
jgi:hypothetical protein